MSWEGGRGGREWREGKGEGEGEGEEGRERGKVLFTMADV